LTPDEGTLRAFLLGTLPPDRSAEVVAWLSSDSSAGEALDRLAAGDALTEVLADTAAAEPVSTPSVDRIIRFVFQMLGGDSHAVSTVGHTPGGDPGTLSEPGAPEPEAPAAPLPAKLGGYRVVREIGRGGMGVVLEAEDPRLNRRVAIKVMNPDRASDPAIRGRFLREAQAAAAVEHDNVVPILHVEEEGGVPFIVMPLLHGESLQSRLKREARLPLLELIRLGREVAVGLAAAHARGLVHRDIKPANVWLDAGSGRARILDFGLARAADGRDGQTAAGVILGTPAYMAPEQVDGQPADARSDLFSLGATLYQCATGRQAFTGPTMTAILRAVTDHHPPPPHEVNPALPRALSDLVMRLIAKAPSARPKSAQGVADDLAAFAEQSTVTLAPGAAARRVGGQGRARRALLIVGGSAALVMAAISAWLLTHPPGPAVVPGTGASDAAQPSAISPTHTAPPETALHLPIDSSRGAPVRSRGWVKVLVERPDPDGKVRLLQLSEPGALPLRKTDKFRVEAQVEPPAYLYVVWVDPGHDVTPLYPWNQLRGWGSRPAAEEQVARLRLPQDVKNQFYRAPDAKPGVATIVLFARTKPLDVPDEEVRKWFEGLPDLPLPPGGEHAAVWFDDYVEVKDPDRPRTFAEVESDDPFARWQGRLQKVLGDRAAFQTAVSFARTGGK
jgi:hypothetical protein